jgi:hypothetical protein
MIVRKRKELTQADFEQYPVWGLFGEDDDLLTLSPRLILGEERR